MTEASMRPCCRRLCVDRSPDLTVRVFVKRQFSFKQQRLEFVVIDTKMGTQLLTLHDDALTGTYSALNSPPQTLHRLFLTGYVYSLS